jgi:hypothetical protein
VDGILTGALWDGTFTATTGFPAEFHRALRIRLLVPLDAAEAEKALAKFRL